MPKEIRKSGAERLKEYRQRVRDDPVKHQEYLRKERERNKKRKEEGKLKCISDLSNREQRKVRKSWRKRQQKHRVLVKRQSEMETFCRASTPPSTSSEADETPEHRPADKKRMRRAKMRNYRKLQKLKQKVKDAQRREAKYKKRCQRLRLRLTSDKSNCSPRTKTQKDVGCTEFLLISERPFFFTIHLWTKCRTNTSLSVIKRNMHSEELSQPGCSENTNLFLCSEKQ